MSWYSSTLNQRLRARTVAAASASPSSRSTVPVSRSSKSIRPARRLRALVVGEDADEQVDRDRRLAAGGGGGRARTPRGVEPPALRPLDLVGEVLGRREPVVAGQPRGRAGTSSGSFESRSSGSGAPSWWSGQKWRSWLRAWAWNVRAVTPGSPSAAEPLDHLAGGLVGERDDEDLVGRDDARSRSRTRSGG